MIKFGHSDYRCLSSPVADRQTFQRHSARRRWTRTCNPTQCKLLRASPQNYVTHCAEQTIRGGFVVIRTVIADDEALARQKLRVLLQTIPDVEIVGEAASPSEIVALVRAKNPHLLFLDICMPGMGGFDVLTELSRSRAGLLPYIIITTAHDQYAVRAFEMQAADYLLKPFTAQRLQAAVHYARERMENEPARGPQEAKPAGNGNP